MKLPAALRYLSLQSKLMTVVLLISLLPVVLLALYSYQQISRLHEHSTSLQDRAHLHEAKVLIEHTLDQVPHDLEMLRQFYDLKRYLLWYNIGEVGEANRWLHGTALRFYTFMQSNTQYMQLRMINSEGREIVRINRKSNGDLSITDQHALQQKKSTDYFINTINLSEHAVYVSKLNLNREHGSIQEPHIPMIRYAIPIIDRNGSHQGIIILNMFAKAFLQQFNGLKENDLDNEKNDFFYMINQQGFYLSHPNEDKRFGFDLNKDDNAQVEHPLLWKALQQTIEGDLKTPDYAYAFSRAYPLHQANGRFWYIVHAVPLREHLAELVRFQQLFIIAIVLLLLVLIVLSRPLIRAMVAPIRKLTDNMQRLARGETHLTTIEYHARDEIHDMVDAAAKMNIRIVEAIAQSQAIARGDFRGKIKPLSAKDSLGLAIQSMTITLRNAAKIAASVAKGNLQHEVTIHDEHDLLGFAVRDMITTLRTTVTHAKRIAQGDFKHDIVPTSDQDSLNQALSEMTITLRETTAIASKLAAGHYDVAVAVKSDHDQLGQALARMTCVLKENDEKNSAQNWLKASVIKIMKAIRGQSSIESLAQTVMPLIAHKLDAPYATFFVLEKTTLQCKGHYACGDEQLNRVVTLGEGLVGQCARDRNIITFDNLPEDYIRVQSSLGETVPNRITAVPLLADGAVIGVIELAALRPLSTIENDFIQQLMPLLGTAIRALQQSHRTEVLLEESQAMTEELQAREEELREFNAELEIKTEDLHASKKQLENQSVVLQQKATEMEQASKYKSEFLANMSHELRTPLNSLLILAEMLANNKEGNLTDKQQEYARTIHGSGTDLLELINSVLDLAKVEAGKMTVDAHNFVLQDMADAIQRDFAHVADNNAVTFQIDLATDLPETMCNDAMKIKHIIKNLLSNAFKFVESHGEVSLNVYRANDHSISFDVRDNGIGIAADKIEQIFAAFQQEDGSTSRKYGGTGLGLSICRELSRLLHGFVHVESEQGKGSCFCFTLPINYSENSQGDKVSSNQAVPITATVVEQSSTEDMINLDAIPNPLDDDRDQLAANQRTILIIEDDEHFAKLLQSLVQEHGYQAIHALRGDYGLALAYHLRPSAILLDLQLPHMDGATVLDRIKQIPTTKHIPVHIISCKGSDRERLLQHGALSFMQKPVKREVLETLLQQIKTVADHDLKRLLIVEDDPVQNIALQALLNETDLEIIVETHGLAALDYLRQHRIDCMILDLHLPDMDGEQLLALMDKEHATINGGKPVPVILHTAQDIDPDVAQRIQQGVRSIIIKGGYASERLLAETRLFLHSVDKADDKAANINQHHASAKLSDYTILLVDDDIRNLFSLSSFLDTSDATVYTARNGIEALDALKEHGDQVDLVLMDIMMPEMDGFEAMRQIRKIEQFANLPILALTAKAMHEDREQCLQAGASDFISKPIDTQQLLSLIKVWLHA